MWGFGWEGSAVRSLSVIFFQMWELATHRVDEEYTGYLTAQPVGEASGWFQPYADRAGQPIRSTPRWI